MYKQYQDLLRATFALAEEMDADVERLRRSAEHMAADGKKGMASGLFSKANTARHFSNKVRALLWERREDAYAIGIDPRRKPAEKEDEPPVNPHLVQTPYVA